MKKIIHFCLLFLLSITCFAQHSAQTLTAAQFILMVKKYHPIIKQAAIEVEKTKTDITLARSAFDPIASHYTTKKTFTGINYFDYDNSSITIPTWFGVEVAAGIENLSGNRFDPSETVGKTNYMSITVPLLKNLVLDKRRAFLQQAKLYNAISIAEQKITVNNILMEAITYYWEWVNAYETYLIIKENVVVNEKRLLLIQKSYANGERAAIDTTEALAQLQSFQYQQNESWMALQNAALQLNAYLWTPKNEPYELPETIIPDKSWDNETALDAFNIDVANLLSTAEKNHPALQAYTYKLNALHIDRKLKFQELLPKLDFKYSQLGKEYNMLKPKGALFENNFQYIIKLEVPLFLRQGRGAFKQAQLKIAETQLDVNQKKLSIALKIKNYYNEFTTYKKQIMLQSNNYKNYKSLVQAEQIKLLNGESSLFLVNSRENKALEAYQKLIDLKTKYYKTIYALQWSTGLLN